MEALAAEGVLDGTSCAPGACDGPVARWEIAVWIVRILDLDPIPHDSFSDIDADRHPADHVEALYDADITAGCASEPLRFCPDRPTTRDEAATFAVRAFGLEATDAAHGFPDIAAGNVHAPNIAALSRAGIGAVHCGDDEARFCPRAPVTGAVAADWLHRASLLAAADSDSATTTTAPPATPGDPPAPTVTAPPPPPPPPTPTAPTTPTTPTVPSTSTGGQQYGQADCPHIVVTQTMWVGGEETVDGTATMGTITIADGVDIVQVQVGRVEKGHRGTSNWLELGGAAASAQHDRDFRRFLVHNDYPARLKKERMRIASWELGKFMDLGNPPSSKQTEISFGNDGGIDERFHSGSGWITVTPVELRTDQNGRRLRLSHTVWSPTLVGEPCWFALMRHPDRQPLP